MQNFDEGEEVFFDSIECLSLEEPVEFGYDIWLKEPQSVKERRESFLRKMGTSELKFVCSAASSDSEPMVSERIHECSGAECSSSASSPIVTREEDLSCAGRDCSSDAHCLVDDFNQACLDDLAESVPALKTKKRRWWKTLLHKMKCRNADVSEAPKQLCKAGKGSLLKVHQNRKKFMEFTAIYAGQEIGAHTGLIWTMKFSPDGQYLASGGEDGVVRIWHITSIDASSEFVRRPVSSRQHGSKKSSHTTAKLPEKVFQIEERPVHEFHGHSAGVLDLAWSTTNCLLSSSKDNNVRLWKVGSDECLGVFHHSNYVTCIQFNPVDENFFISGSIDGKVRVWRVTEKRVADWADVQDIVTAICYQPNGRGLIVGSISGICRFYEAGSELSLDAEIHIGGKKRSNSNMITGIQFLLKDSQRVMITSGDSKIRILDGHEVVCKYRGLSKSRSQMCAAFTSTRKHVISVGEDSRIYLWNYEDISFQESKQVKSERSCEHFMSKSVSVAIPWSGHSCGSSQSWSQMQEQQDAIPKFRDSERFSIGNWFSMDISSRGSVTWPEEVLPLSDVPTAENDNNLSGYHEQLQDYKTHIQNSTLQSPAWGLVIVTAGWDGKIRTFHNYGLPVRI